MKKWMRLGYAAGLCAFAWVAGGCGNPNAAEGGGPMDFPVNAVVARVTPQTVEDRVEAVATLESRDAVSIRSELDEKIVDIAFREGDDVQANDVLFRLEETRTRARLDEAESRFRLAELSYERNRRLLENQTISQQEYDEAEAEYANSKAALALARDADGNTAVTAPFAGRTGEREVSVGQFVTTGQALTRLMRLDPLDLVFDVPERFLDKIGEGLTVTFTADAYPEERFEGRLFYIAPGIDQRTRTIRVKAEIANPEGRLRPGLFGAAVLVLDRRDEALVIPEASVRYTVDGAQVVAVNRDGKAEFRPVAVGRRLKGRAEIVEGLAAGDLVVVEGYQKMGPGSTVMASEKSREYGVTPGPLGAGGASGDATPGASDADH